MRRFMIERDSDAYRKVLQKNETAGQPMDDQTLAKQPNDARILTGNKTGRDPKTGRDYGTGPSPHGFVMSGNKVLGYVNLERRNLMTANELIIK